MQPSTSLRLSFGQLSLLDIAKARVEGKIIAKVTSRNLDVTIEINLIKETDAILPQNSYGLTKYVSELLLQDFSKSNSFLNLCIGRIFSFYHDTQKPPFLYPNLKKRFETEDLNAPFVLYGANSTRDFLPAEEVCSIIIKIVDKRAKGVVNIASGKPIKIIDFVKKIAPVNLNFKINSEEKTNHLNADITLLNSIIENE